MLDLVVGQLHYRLEWKRNFLVLDTKLTNQHRHTSCYWVSCATRLWTQLLCLSISSLDNLSRMSGGSAVGIFWNFLRFISGKVGAKGPSSMLLSASCWRLACGSCNSKKKRKEKRKTFSGKGRAFLVSHSSSLSSLYIWDEKWQLLHRKNASDASLGIFHFKLPLFFDDM